MSIYNSRLCLKCKLYSLQITQNDQHHWCSCPECGWSQLKDRNAENERRIEHAHIWVKEQLIHSDFFVKVPLVPSEAMQSKSWRMYGRVFEKLTDKEQQSVRDALGQGYVSEGSIDNHREDKHKGHWLVWTPGGEVCRTCKGTYTEMCFP